MTKSGFAPGALVPVEDVICDDFTADERAFFAEGDAMSQSDSVPIAEIIDLPSYQPRGYLERTPRVTDDYYESFSLSIEADEMSGLCEAA